MASGGDRGTRTPNLRDANAALSHLSYIPAARATGGGGGRFTIGPGRRHGQGVGPSPPWPWPSAAPPAPTAKPLLPRDPSGWPSRHQPFAQPRPHSRAYGRLAAWAAASGPRLTLPRSSVVEQSAVNRLAVGSSPTAGANSARRGPLGRVGESSDSLPERSVERGPLRIEAKTPSTPRPHPVQTW